jgi:hypothetical protein
LARAFRGVVMVTSKETRQPFVPKGAIAFFAVMVLVYGAFWLIMFLLMIARG